MGARRDPWPCWLCGANLYDVNVQPGDTVTVGLHPLVGSIVLCPRCTVEMGIVEPAAMPAAGDQAAAASAFARRRGGRLAGTQKRGKAGRTVY